MSNYSVHEYNDIYSQIDDEETIKFIHPLHFAILSGDLSLIKKFCTSEYINNNYIDQNTPLHLAVSCGNFNIFKRIKIIKILVTNGSNLNLKNKFNQTPLYLATLDASKQILVPILLDLGSYPFETYSSENNNIILLDWLKKSWVENNIKEIVRNKLLDHIHLLKLQILE
jgi:ankyrin repeat protein